MNRNRYYSDIKRQRRNLITCAALLAAFIVLVYSVGAEEQQTGQRECASCHQPDLKTYTRYRNYWNR